MSECPNCHLSAYVRHTFLGERCSFCGEQWPSEGER